MGADLPEEESARTSSEGRDGTVRSKLSADEDWTARGQFGPVSGRVSLGAVSYTHLDVYKRQYLKNLALPREQAPVKVGIKGTVGSPTVEVRPGQFQMKPDVTL